MTATAVALVLASAALHATWSVAIKGSRDPLTFNVLQALPSALLGGGLLTLALRGGAQPPVAFWAGLAVTGLAHGLYFLWMTLAYERSDLSVAYPIIRSTPAVLPLAAIPILGEIPSVLGAAGIAVTVGGMWLLHSGGRIGLAALRTPGTGFAYLTLAMTVVYGLADKWLMAVLEGSPWSGAWPRALFVLLAINAAGGAVFLPLALWRMRGDLRARLGAGARREGARAGSAIAISFVGYGLILEALRSAPASYVVTVRQASVVFVVLLSFAWLREPVTRPRAVGALATVAGVALVGLRG